MVGEREREQERERERERLLTIITRMLGTVR